MQRFHSRNQTPQQKVDARAGGRVQRCEKADREREREKKMSLHTFFFAAEIHIMSKLFNPRIALFMGAYIPDDPDSTMAIVSEVLHGDM